MYLSSVSFSWLLSLNRNNAGVSITFCKNRHIAGLQLTSPQVSLFGLHAEKTREAWPKKVRGVIRRKTSLLSFLLPITPCTPLNHDSPSNSEFTQQVGSRKRMAKRLCETDVTGLLVRVLSWSSLHTNVFWSFTKRSVWSKVKFGENLFQTKLLSRLSHKVLPSCCVSLLILIGDWETTGNQTWFAATTRRPQRLTITKLFPFGGNWTLFFV